MIQPFQLKGQWFLPGSNDTISGLLRFSPGEPILLELYGSLSREFSDNSTVEIILGLTEKGKITLVNCYPINQNTTNGLLFVNYEPTHIFKGVYFNTIHSLHFRKVSFDLFNFYNWFSISGRSFEFSAPNQHFSLGYERMPAISFILKSDLNGEISFGNSLSTSLRTNSTEIRESLRITFNYTQKTKFLEILKDIDVLTKFVTLMSFEQSYPTSIQFMDPDYKEEFMGPTTTAVEKPIGCFFKDRLFNPAHSRKTPKTFFLDYSSVSSGFPGLIQKWYSMNQEMPEIFDLVLDHFNNRGYFKYHKFMECARAIEKLHGYLFNSTRIPIEKHQALVSNILTKVDLKDDPENENWLRNILRHNDPFLSQRIYEVIETYTNSYIQQHIKKAKNFGHRVTASRNYYTHFSEESKKRAEDGLKLLITTRKLRGIIISALLTELGIEKHIIEKGLQDHLIIPDTK
ncbi:ApeA N-terminal domain 1-containing protein [Aegicerativicinus sediminis]|uniref:ApeA N-terminal domain 1-containing protein n=1 Tax=Aegicerativicinus sediminis TaxID=2893202 RepID=UPI001E62C28D|nr:HEPN domain-containing protein [Aegicerativicinus sediminis]